MKRTEHPFHRNKTRFRPKDLTHEIATTSLASLRQVWTPSTIANGLTPVKLATVLQAAETGQHHDQLELAESMEERDAHYGSVLRTRKLAIQGLDPTVESYSDAPRDIELAEAIRDLIRKPDFGDLVDDLTDALGKGYSAVTITWEHGQRWAPRFRWCDPRWFVWDQDTGRQLRLIDEADPVNGVELAPRRWIVHVPRIKSGLPSRSGLARLAAVAYMCKSWAMKDWMAFADVFGLPLRVGRYGPGATKDDINTLLKAIRNIASDAGAVIPDSMDVEFVEAAKGSGGGDAVFERLAKYLDAQISKAVLGHTGTADSTPGKLGGEDQADEVRLDILIADAKQLQATLNRDLVKPYIDINFGVQENYPLLCLPVPEPEDTKLLVDAVKELVPLGLKVEQSVMRDKLGLPDPEIDAAGNPVNELLVGVPQSVPPEPVRHRAAHRAQTERDDVDAWVAQLTQPADAAVDDWLTTIREALDQAIAAGRSLAEVQEILLSTFGALEPDALVEVMAEAMAAAELTGRAHVDDGD